MHHELNTVQLQHIYFSCRWHNNNNINQMKKPYSTMYIIAHSYLNADFNIIIKITSEDCFPLWVFILKVLLNQCSSGSSLERNTETQRMCEKHLFLHVAVDVLMLHLNQVGMTFKTPDGLKQESWPYKWIFFFSIFFWSCPYFLYGDKSTGKC